MTGHTERRTLDEHVSGSGSASALIQSPDDFALLEAGWFRSPSTTVPEGMGCKGQCGMPGVHVHVTARRVVVSPPEQCIPHPCSAPTCRASHMVADSFLAGVEDWWETTYYGNLPVRPMPEGQLSGYGGRRQALLVRVTLTGGPIPVVDQPLDGPECVSVASQGFAFYWREGEAYEHVNLSDVLGGKVAPGDELWRCTTAPLDEPIVEELCLGKGHAPVPSCRGRWPLDLPLAEFISLEMEQP